MLPNMNGSASHQIKKLPINKLQWLVAFCIAFIVVASTFTTFNSPQYYCYSNCKAGQTTACEADCTRKSSCGEVPLEPLTIHCNAGRLGNQMCTFATLYGLSTLNNRNMSLFSCNHEKLTPYFDIQTPVVDMRRFQERHPHLIDTFYRRTDSSIPPDSNIIKGYIYPCSFTFFDHVRDDFKKIFRFRPHIQQYAETILSNASSHLEGTVLVGVHVRRTDYLKSTKGNNAWLLAFGGREVDMEYFEKATKYYKDKYRNVVFIAVSDDRQWCRENLAKFGIWVTEDSPSPAHDMAILANCNHTIMTYGTFGFWGGYLAGGEVVYFKNFLRPGTWFTTHEFIQHKMYLPEWVGIATTYKWQK